MSPTAVLAARVRDLAVGTAAIRTVYQALLCLVGPSSAVRSALPFDAGMWD